MTTAAYQGRCPTCGHDHDADKAEFDRVMKATRPEERAIEALKLAKAWIEQEEDRTMAEILDIEKRFNERGSIGFNQQFIAMCRAVEATLSPQLEKKA